MMADAEYTKSVEEAKDAYHQALHAAINQRAQASRELLKESMAP